MRHTKDPTDQDLIAACREGDSQAFRILVSRYESVVAATVVGMLGPGPDADDVGQMVFVRFHRHIQQFRGASALSTYLTRIAMNESLTQLKRRKRWFDRFRPLAEHTSPESAADRIDHTDRAEVVQRALERLPDAFRAVVVLRHFQGLSTRETASVLAIPEGTVVSRLARAHGKLRALLATYHD